MHYQRLRYWALKTGTWEPQLSGNFGDPEGHRLSAKMGGDKRAEDPEGLAEAGRKGYQTLIERYPDIHHYLGKLGGKAASSNPDVVRERGRLGAESRWKQHRELKLAKAVKEDASNED